MVVAHFFESASDAVYGGRSRAHRLMPAQYAGQHRDIAAIDEKALGRATIGFGPQSGFPTA